MYRDDRTTTDRARLEQYSAAVMEREKKVHELKSRFEDLVQEAIEPQQDGSDIPEIKEGMDGDVSAMARRKAPYEKWIVVLGMVVVATILGYLLATAPIKAHGELVPQTRVVVRAPMDGFLSEANYTEGQRIEQGNSLGHLQVMDFDEDSLLQKKAEADVLSNQIQLSEQQTARLEQLIDKCDSMVDAGAMTVIQLEELHSKYELALQQRDELKRELLATQEEATRIHWGLEQCRLLSPISGVVVTRGLRGLNHGFYEKGDQIAEVIDPAVMVAQVLVPEKDAKRLGVGQTAKVRWATSSGWQVGKVAKIGEHSGKPMLTLNDMLVEDRSVKKKGVMVQIKFDDQDQAMKYGMDVEARIARQL